MRVCQLLGVLVVYCNADVYCYECGDSILDPNLMEHLASFGIDMTTLEKTESSLEGMTNIVSWNSCCLLSAHDVQSKSCLLSY